MPSTTQALNKRIVADAFARWADDEGTFLELLSERVTWVVQGSGPSAITTQSRQEYVDRMVTPMARRFSRPLRPTVKGMWADDDTVVVHWEGDAVANDGIAYHNAYAWIFRMRDGEAVAVTAFLDLTAYDAVIARVAPRSSAP